MLFNYVHGLRIPLESIEESAWGLAVAGCGNSDGLSEQSMEIVAVGLVGRDVMLTSHKGYIFSCRRSSFIWLRATISGNIRRRMDRTWT